VEVLVDAVTPARSHDHEEGAPDAADAHHGRVSGRTREHKLVHLAGGPELLGRFVTARIEHAGPYALRGTVLGAS
jgi:hypothetical protein